MKIRNHSSPERFILCQKTRISLRLWNSRCLIIPRGLTNGPLQTTILAFSRLHQNLDTFLNQDHSHSSHPVVLSLAFLTALLIMLWQFPASGTWQMSSSQFRGAPNLCSSLVISFILMSQRGLECPWKITAASTGRFTVLQIGRLSGKT